MNCIFIYNPVGGKGKIAKKLDFIVSELEKKYDTVDVYATKCAGDMSRMARESAQNYDAIVFAGGDGSFNEMVEGLGCVENMPQLGYIPSGTVNDIAHTLKIPTNTKKALKIIQTGRTELLDCMKVNDHYVMYVVAAGAFTSTTYATPQTQKNHMGRIAYGFEGIKHNLKFQVFEITCEGETTTTHTDSVLIAVMNSRYVAGFGLNKKASLQDGKLEVAIIRQNKTPNFFRKCGALFDVARLFLFGYKVKMKHLVKLEGSSFDIKTGEEVTWTFDGEKGQSGNVHIEVIPRKINMIVPKKLKKV